MAVEGKLENMRSDEVTVIISSSERYSSISEKVLNLLIEERGFPGVYVTINRPYETLTNDMKKYGINQDKMFFIDAISKDTGREDPGVDNAIFLDSPKNLTDLSIAMSQANDSIQGQHVLFFDSLSALAVHNQSSSVEEFAHYLFDKMRNQNNVIGVIVALEEGTDDQLISRTAQFADKVIRSPNMC